MNFGDRLRASRKAKGWSRQQVEIFTGGIVSAETIKALEYGINQEPRNGTRAAILKLFPELGINNKESLEVR